MSFWPFSNASSNNSNLQKYLDSVQDISGVTTPDLIEDAILLQELLNELHSIKGSYNKSNTGFHLLQQFQTQEANGSFGSNSDTFSVTSSNNESLNTHTKDARDIKLLELLLQPHILNGFLDYIYMSVDYFHSVQLKEDEKLAERLATIESESSSLDEVKKSGLDLEDNEVEVEQTEDLHQEQSEGGKDGMGEQAAEEEETQEEKEDEKKRRCIQVASEILSLDLWLIMNRIIETHSIMNKLWLILLLPNLKESSPSVTYVVHILDQLMDTNSIELLNYVRRQDNIVTIIVEKIDVPVIMDFILRIIQTDKSSSPTGIIEVLAQQQLIPRLIDLLKPEPSQFVSDSNTIPNPELFFKQTAATDFLKALITISSNTALAVVLETNIGPNQLTRELASPKIVNIMINDIILYRHTFDDGATTITNKHGINNCVGIIIELIRKNNSDYDLDCDTYGSMLQNGNPEGVGEVNSYVMFHWLKDFERNPPSSKDAIYLGEMLEIFSDNLNNFYDLMNIKENEPSYSNKNLHSLGFTKFKIAELIAELLHCSNMILLNSRKIRHVVKVRDELRLKQSKRIKRALNETCVTDNYEKTNKNTVSYVTTGLDDVSLDDINFVDGSSGNNVKRSENSSVQNAESRDEFSDDHEREGTDYTSFFESLEAEYDSEDDEPKISSENPFVCPERDQETRRNPCVGDDFKIKLADLKLLLDIISKLPHFPWHNFFHNVVFDLIQQIFNGKLNSYNSFLIEDLFNPKKCDLITLIIQAHKSSAEPRPGYMGHLILISEEVVKFTSLYKPDLISSIIVQAILSSDWDWFVNEVLLKTREVYNVVLGAEDEDDDRKATNKHQEPFEFDSSVGYLDLDSYENGSGAAGNKNMIILGDKSNHDMFLADQGLLNGFGDQLDEDEHMEETQVPDVRIQHSPRLHDLSDKDTMEDFDNDEFGESYNDNEFLDDLAGSSSSEDEDDFEEEDNNELRRVPRHND